MNERHIKNRCYLYVQKTTVFVLLFVLVFSDMQTIFNLSFLPSVEKVFAANGDFSVFTESTGATVIDATGVPLDVTWGTTVSSNVNIPIQPNTSDIDLTEGGKYLVMYNVWSDQGASGGTNRRSINTYLTLAGTELPYGRGAGYVRDSEGLTMAYNSGATIVDAVAGDDLQVHIQRDDTNTGAGLEIMPSSNGVSVLKMPSNIDYFRAHLAATSSAVNGFTTFTDMVWDTADEVDTGSFGFTPSSAIINVSGSDGANFLVTANVGLFVSAGGTTRQNYEMRLVLDGVEVPGSRVTSYIRGTNDTWYGQLAYSGIIAKNLSADQVLKLQIRRESSGGATTVIMGDKSGIAVAAIPDIANVVRLDDNSGTQTTSNTVANVTFDTQAEIDANNFSHSTTTSSSQVNIDAADDYVFFATAFTDTTTSGNNRQPFRVDWDVNGTAQNYGSFGALNRANTSFSGGASGGLLLNGLTASDYVQLSQYDESSNAPVDSTFGAGRVSMQGLALNDNFFGTDVFVSATGTHAVSTEIPSTDVYAGGGFVIKENSGTRNVSSIVINESGTVDGQNGLANIKLYYDQDTTAPYDCTGESYDPGVDAQFGATDTNGFSGADGSSSFSGSVEITTTKAMCVYVVYDVTSAASDGQTALFSIDNPSTEVSLTGTPTVGPSVPILPTLSTELQSYEFTQIHYHWRNDDGTEAGATSATGGSEDTALGAVSIGAPKRLRMEVSHEGSRTDAQAVSILDAYTTGSTKTISSGEDRLFVVGIHSEDSASNVDVNTVSYGGQTLTELSDEQVTTVASNGMWVGYLTESQIAAASGSTIAPTWTGGAPDTAVLYSSVVYENVDQSTPISGWSGNTGTSVATIQPTTTVSVAEGDVAAYFTVSSGLSVHTAAAGFTEGTEETSNSGAANAYKLITVGGTEQPTADWTSAQTRLAIVALNIQFKEQREGLLQYKLQYGVKVSTCSAISGWTDVAEDGGHWDTSDSASLVFGDDSTNIAEGIGGVTNEGATFVGSNGVLDTGDKSLSTILDTGEYTELEYTVVPTSSAVEGNTYCFRTVDGTPDTTHTYRIPLTIQSSQVGATLTDFPVFVDLADMGSHFFSNVDASGADIRVTTDDGLTEVAREVVSISTGGKTGELHFRAPTISATTDTTFYIYYGGGVGEYQASSTYGTNGVWAGNYSGVYHLDETGSTYFDSTINNNDGIGEAVDPSAITGKLGDGQDFALNGRIDLGTGSSVDLNASGEYYVSTWLNLDSSGTDQSPVSQYTGVGDFLFWADTGGLGTGFCHYNGSYLPASCQDDNDQNIGTWQYVVAYHTGTAAGIYLNGAETGDGPTTNTAAVDAAERFAIGAQNGDSTARYFDGQIDEVRIATVNFGLDWSVAEYTNQNTPTTFYSTSTEETLSRSPIDVVYDVYPEATINADAIVSATGTQIATVNENSVDNYIGGGFVIQANTGTPNVTEITLTENGTVDGSTSLENIKLYYDLDTTVPRDCTGEVYNAGSDSQFGATDADGFSSANGTSTFSGTVGISTTQSLCLYVVLDVNATSTNGETIDIQISAPNSEVVISVGSVAPGSTVGITGSTTIAGPITTQTHYHWRNDDGTEAGATSATLGVEDTAITAVAKETTKRLRMQVSNEGTVTTGAEQYRLEYGTKVTTCTNVGTWNDVGEVGGAFGMVTTANLTEGSDTTDIATTTGGLTNENTTFLTPNGGQRDTTSQTGNLTLSSTNFVELEYAIEATVDAGDDTDYCFRLTLAGVPLEAYTTYAEFTTREKQDFFIQRGVATITGTSITLVAGTDYTAVSASTSAFIRITNTQHTGAGNNTGGGNTNADDFTAYIQNPENIETSITLARPAAALSNTRVAWEIIEFIGIPTTDNEMKVRYQGTVGYAATALTATGTAVNNVVDNTDVVVFITGQSNENTGASQLNDGLSVAEWNATNTVPVFHRGDADSVVSNVSYAVVEFTGVNWNIQRVEHAYVAAGVTETESITAVASIGRTFLHTQKSVGVGLNGLDEYGHEVWLSSIGAVSFQLQSGAGTPADHTSVVWVMENTQTGTGAMQVHQSNGSLGAGAGGGAEPLSELVSIGATLSNITNASIWANNRGSGTGTAFPRTVVAATLVSETLYEMWRSDTGQTQTFRVEVVNWPVAELSLRQNYYRFYVDNDALDPTDPYPIGASDLGENTSITGADDPLGETDRVRIRMSFHVNNASMPEATESLKLQYGKRDTVCSAIGAWVDVGAPGDGTIWRGYNGSVTDGTALATSTPATGTLNLSVSDAAGTYEDQNNSAVNPYAVDIGEDVEYDWMIEHNGATQLSDYCFRAVKSDGTELSGYDNYPTLRTTGYTPVIANWQWFDDAINVTPVTPLASENVTPVDLVNENEIKLRVTAAEVEGAPGVNVKFLLQYSEYVDFSDGGNLVIATSSCMATSTWCYADAGGVDNAVINTTVLSDGDSCVAGVGDGCGTHNEAATTTSTHAQSSFAKMEYEFTIKQVAARPNAVYYFRLYDVTNDVPLAASSSYPSLVSEGASLVFSISGLPASTFTESIETDILSTASGVAFGSLPFDTDYEAAHRLTVNTNATEGYQMLMYVDQNLINSYGTPIPVVTGTNASPLGWNAGCSGAATGCVGYHAGDDLLQGGSARFGADDSYAAFSTTPQEVMYSSVPTNESHDIVYKIKVGQEQPAGDYQENITYIAVPVF